MTPLKVVTMEVMASPAVTESKEDSDMWAGGRVSGGVGREHQPTPRVKIGDGQGHRTAVVGIEGRKQL